MDKLFLSVHVLVLFFGVVHGDTISSALGVTMAQAQQAHRLMLNMDLSSFDKRGKSACDDCLELYSDSIHQLNRSLHGSNNNDARTWLSAAITNQQTCRNGFIDFKLLSSHYLKSFPFMVGNFSKLLSNSLAIINKAAASASGGRRWLAGGHDQGFPEWVSAADRKLLESPGTEEADIVVAKDGSGDYMTISEAVKAASVKQTSGAKRLVIRVKSGVYNENVVINKKLKNLTFIGDGIDATIVTGDKNVQDGSTTFRSATFAISGDGFIARDMTFENTAGPEKHQAVALMSNSDYSVFYNCSMKGYQDTLYVHAHRQFYRNCDIYGTIDFIFGNAAAVFQNCNIYVRKPMSGQSSIITAQGRSNANANTGIVIHNSRVTAATAAATSDLEIPDQGSFKTYLGRPWKRFSRTVFIKCFLDSLIDPAGWLPERGNFALSTLYYGEYMNTGAGADTSARVDWPGYHVITSETEAQNFTVANFLDGDSWIPDIGVPFTSSL